jgi:sarcosine oxidase subunit alpha
MLNENGVIIDDSVFVRLAQDHFVVHTTSGGAQRIAEWMEEWLQCEWRDLQVIVHDATSQWACFTLAGPRAHETLAGLDCAGDLSKGVLPHMATAGVSINGIEARILRASYSGEASYEISVPVRLGGALLRAIMAAGAPCGIEPFGIEALMILRTEKGLLHVGTDTDGSTTPDDVGWGHVARRKNRDFIGRRSLSRPANTAAGRKQLVGLEPVDSDEPMAAGGHLLLGEGNAPPAETDGWVTSACYSPNLERHIGLGMLRDGRSHMGATVLVCDEARQYRARVVSPVFVDPENHRLS